MKRRFFLKLVAASIAATNLYKVPQLHAQTVSSQNSLLSLQLNLSGAGRLGFYIDYSERETVGDHTFYVTRTHGSQGALSVTYATEGDTHTSVSGSISWADGDMSIKSFTVEVTGTDLNTHQNTLGLGEHRVVARLSNPTNNAVLHFGTEETKAYSVIDNGVLASDANALFYDSAAVTNGTGAQTSPYNSVYDAIANIGSKRYLYGKGTTLVDNTFTDNLAGPVVGVLPSPATRASESERVYVRNWSGNTWTISSGNIASAGFYGDAGQSYITYKGIDFLTITATTSSAFAILYFYGGSVGINIENCSGTDIDGKANANHGAFLLWGVNGSKVWRCTGDNIKDGGSTTTGNTSMLSTYDGTNLSVQRCEATNTSALMYQKRVAAPFDVSTSVRFCKDATQNGVFYGASGGAGVPHSYTIVQCNVFLPTGGSNIGLLHNPGTGVNGTDNADKHWWCNNVFYQRGGGENGAIQFNQAYNAIIFNNIYLDCRRLWREPSDSSSRGPVMEYADYELHFGTTLAGFFYEYQGTSYGSAAELQAVRPDFAVNDVNSDPLFTNAVGGDFTLQVTSPALTGGVSGTQQGVYLLGIEKIGENDLNNAPPEKMAAPKITILDS